MIEYRNFICYRGGESPGKQIASQLFNVLDEIRDKVGLTYLSTRGTPGDAQRNYLRDIELLQTVENVILILTPDYLDDFLTDEAEPNTDSVAWMEFDTILDSANAGRLRGIVPVFCGGFSWRSDNPRLGIPNKEIIDCIWGQAGVEVFTAATGNGHSHEASSRMPDTRGAIPDGVLDYVTDSIRVGFPLAYVSQAGHVVYLPTLLETTPFEYTFIVLSDRSEGCASELNYAREEGDHVWSEYSYTDFISSDCFDLPEQAAVVVNVPEDEAGLVIEVLNQRRKKAPSIPLLVNIFGKDRTIACRDIVAKHVPVLNDAPGALLIQTDHAAVPPLLSEQEIRVLHNASPAQCWRRLLGNSGYSKLARTILEEGNLRDLYLLATEETRENLICWRTEKLQMLGDVVMREETDTNQQFLLRMFDWERI